ncbi:response regulator transcription factor [Paenibacillus zanthoxyli]|uniref:response regulator transcription factor n=1 Tax=Paenibacillus zanthoxyli TaxID=369399 RepID=UPI00046EE3D7|nr:response regulator transcription factor [Paenibacillus zanthoxyli]
MEMQEVSVLLIGKQEIVMFGLESYLTQKDGMHVVSRKYKSEQGSYEEIQLIQPDVIILGLSIEHPNIFVFIEHIREKFHDLKIIMYSSYKSSFLEMRTISSGANAYITRDISLLEVYSTILMVHDQFTISQCKGIGQDDLSPQEQRVLELITLGYTNKEIAAKLHACERTVSYYVNNLFNKMNAKRRVEVALKGVIKGYINNEIIETLLE